MRRLSVHAESWASRIPFRIAGKTWTQFEALVVQIADHDLMGQSEARGVFYMDDGLDDMSVQIQSAREAVLDGATREDLLGLLPPGGARNALDTALWDLEAQQQGTSAWALAGVEAAPVDTVFTIGLEDTPDAMGRKAGQAEGHSLLKIKLDADRPLERMQAIRDARPDARLVVDANQAWTMQELDTLAPAFASLGVSMIEQPLPRGADAELAAYTSPVPLCADESCLHIDELAQAAERYQMINIKLDKCGGLTAGLALEQAARARGLGVMVGCMAGTSLAMAPHHVLAQRCDLVDIDGPLLLAQDRLDGLQYEGGRVHVPERCCWGRPR